MDLNLDTLKREILSYLESRDFAVFRSAPGTLDGTQMVLWDTENYPDYQMFLEAATKVGPYSTENLPSRLNPRHRLLREFVERLHAQLEVLLFCVLDLIVTDAVQTLNKHHHGRHSRTRDFGGVVQGA